MSKIIKFETLKYNKTGEKYLQQILELPEYYGHNLDALYDCLTSISEPTIIHIVDPHKLDSMLLKTFIDAGKENHNLEVIL